MPPGNGRHFCLRRLGGVAQPVAKSLITSKILNAPCSALASLHPARETLQKWRVFPLTFISLMPMPTSRRVRFGDMQNHEDGFIAEYDSGVCTACGLPIQAGQRIATSWGGRVTRYHHVLPCPGSAPIVCSICGGNWWKCSCP
jgi:hypothetical protein